MNGPNGEVWTTVEWLEWWAWACWEQDWTLDREADKDAFEQEVVRLARKGMTVTGIAARMETSEEEVALVLVEIETLMEEDRL